MGVGCPLKLPPRIGRIGKKDALGGGFLAQKLPDFAKQIGGLHRLA